MTTINCQVPEQQGIPKACTATFTASGCCLVVNDLPLGHELPDRFTVEVEGCEFDVELQGEQHMVSNDGRNAFAALAFG